MSEGQDYIIGWDHFSLEEMQCSHTGECKMDSEFMQLLHKLREAYAKPMIISSGYRSPSHPVEARKKSDKGSHCQGRAVDVVCHGTDAFNLIHAAIHSGITRIGVAQKGAISSRYLHLDNIETGKPSPWIWSY